MSDKIYTIKYLAERNVSLSPGIMKTLATLLELKEATASDVSKKTRRPRTVESRNLNRLNKLGLVGRMRIGKKVYYYEIETAVRKALESMRGTASPDDIGHAVGLPAHVVAAAMEKLLREQLGKAGERPGKK